MSATPLLVCPDQLTVPAPFTAGRLDTIACYLALGHRGLHESGPAEPWRNVMWTEEMTRR